MKEVKKKGRVRAYFLSLILTSIAIAFVAGLTIADIGSRGILGNNGGVANVFLASSSNKITSLNDGFQYLSASFNALLNFISNGILSLTEWLRGN